MEYLYELNKFNNEIPTIFEIAKKIKNKLQICHFSEVNEKLSCVLEKISAKTNIF